MTVGASRSAAAPSILIVADAVANLELLPAGSAKAPPSEQRRQRCVSPTRHLYSWRVAMTCLAPPLRARPWVDRPGMAGRG